MSNFNVGSRIEQLRMCMQEQKVDAFLALRSLSVQYLTGFDDIADASDPHAVLVTADTLRFMTDGRYIDVVQGQAKGSDWTVDSFSGTTLAASLIRTWDIANAGIVALEDTVSYRQFSTIANSATIVPAKKWIENIRKVKDEAELERIAAAAAINDEAFPYICEYIRPGLCEAEVALELEITLRRLGADGCAFPAIVAAGPNASFPHAVPEERTIQAGDLVKLDFGASYKGYASDMTRTVFVSGGGTVRPNNQQQLVYETVRKAQEAGLAAIKAGVTGAEVDAAARTIIEQAGFGKYFTHGLGHGVGMQVHELPGVSMHSKTPLPENSVITCEPGIYIPNELGVRIEDLVIAQQNGYKNLTSSPKELLIV